MCGPLVFQPLKWFHNPLMGHDLQLKKHDVRHDFGGIKQKSDASAFINKLDFYSGKMRTQKIPIRRCLWLYTFNLGIFPVTSKDARARVKPSQHHQITFFGSKESQNWKFSSFQHWLKSKHLVTNALTRISLDHGNKHTMWPQLLF